MFLRKLILFIFLVILSLAVQAQKHQNNWYFGTNAAITFTGSPVTPSVKSDNAMKTRASVSISDSTTGELLFYSDGRTVWDKNHQVMPNGDKITVSAIQGALAVPNPANRNQYYIFTIGINGMLEYALLDMSLNGGLGDVTTRNNVVFTNTAHAITTVKHRSENAYWLITHSSQNPVQNIFRVYKISTSGVSKTPIESVIGEKGNSFGDLVSNNDGTKLAITFYDDDNALAQVFDFDKQCGTVNNVETLHKEADWDYTYGAAFSPDDSKLYIAYGYLESQLVQYSGANFNQWSVVATDAQNFNDILIGPDGKLYINTHDNGIPSPNIDVVHNPNSAANTINYQKNFISLGGNATGYFEFPNYITDKSNPQSNGGTQGLGFTYANTCINDSTSFTLTGNTSLPDSIKWHFLDTNSTDTVSRLLNPAHKFTKKGVYWVVVNYWRCGAELLMAKQVTIVDAADITLGADTSFCFGDSITLKSNAPGMQHVWSTGETTENITITNGGWYWAKITTPTCSATDSIYVTELPPILVELGNGFTVCEHDTDNLVKLDAGKGYNHYKWSPTGDTTQWIIVKQAGDYYVVVEDYRGCKGDDGSKVVRLCGFDFHIPNAFTPDGDGLNDVFKPLATDVLDFEFEIYNSWGERVFMTNNPQQGWDGMYNGKSCPEGVYLYKIRFKGFSNKLLKVFNHKGNISLLR